MRLPEQCWLGTINPCCCFKTDVLIRGHTFAKRLDKIVKCSMHNLHVPVCLSVCLSVCLFFFCTLFCLFVYCTSCTCVSFCFLTLVCFCSCLYCLMSLCCPSFHSIVSATCLFAPVCLFVYYFVTVYSFT